MKDNKIKEPKSEVPELKEFVIQGGTYLTTFHRKYLNRQKWEKPDKKKVISFIPGTVRQIFVKKGDNVKTEDKLLVLEAMKMMNTIYSPLTGKIKSVLVKEGDRQPKGTVMIEFE